MLPTRAPVSELPAYISIMVPPYFWVTSLYKYHGPSSTFMSLENLSELSAEYCEDRGSIGSLRSWNFFIFTTCFLFFLVRLFPSSAFSL